MKRKFIGMTVLLLLGCAKSAETQPYWRQVEKRGAAEVVRELSSYREEWDTVLARVRTGSPDWLELAAALKSGANATSAFELSSSVALALPKNPGGVLDLIGTGAFELSLICANPLESATPNQILEYQQLSRVALLRVNGNNKQLARKCLESLSRR
jgi:hypothetical protein